MSKKRLKSMEKVLANFLTWINTFSFLAPEIRCATMRTAFLATIIPSLQLVEEKQYVDANINDQ